MYGNASTQQLDENDNVRVQIHDAERLHHRRVDDFHPIYVLLFHFKLMPTLQLFRSAVAVAIVLHHLSLNSLIFILLGDIFKVVLFGDMLHMQFS